MARAIDLAKELKDQGDPLGDFISKAEDDQVKRDLDKVNSLLSATPTEKLAELGDLQGKVIERFQAGSITAREFAEAMDILDDRFRKIADVSEETADKMSAFAEQAARNIQDQLGETLFNVAKGNFDNILDAWGDMLLKMASQAAAAQIGEYLFGKGGTGGLLSTFLTGIGSSGGTTVTGDVGVTSAVQGTSGKLSAGRGVTIINNVQAGPSRNEMMAALQLTQQQQAAATQKQLRAAGVA